MIEPDLKTIINRQLINIDNVIKIFGMSKPWFYNHRRLLEAEGFPKPVPYTKKYDPIAVKLWFDKLAMVAPNDDMPVKQKQWMDRLKNGKA